MNDSNQDKNKDQRKKQNIADDITLDLSNLEATAQEKEKQINDSFTMDGQGPIVISPDTRAIEKPDDFEYNTASQDQTMAQDQTIIDPMVNNTIATDTESPFITPDPNEFVADRTRETATITPNQVTEKHRNRVEPPTQEGGILKIGEIIGGKYRVSSFLGRGGMGEVYKVLHIELEKDFAMKILISSVTSAHRRFIEEAKTAMGLVHEHAIQVRDVGTTEKGFSYFTMDYSQGLTLQETITKEGPLSEERALRITRQILTALNVLHSRRDPIVHRDLKPANVIMEQRGMREHALVLDFGIAKTIDEASTENTMMIGTPQYMPPEQILGGRLDHRSDHYAVGVMLFEMVTGQRPFNADTMEGLIGGRLTKKPEPRTVKEDITVGVEQIIQKSLAQNIEERYETTNDFIAVIDQFLNSAPDSPLRSTRIKKPKKKIFKTLFYVALLVGLAATIVFFMPQIKKMMPEIDKRISQIKKIVKSKKKQKTPAQLKQEKEKILAEKIQAIEEHYQEGKRQAKNALTGKSIKKLEMARDHAKNMQQDLIKLRIKYSDHFLVIEAQKKYDEVIELCDSNETKLQKLLREDKIIAEAEQLNHLIAQAEELCHKAVEEEDKKLLIEVRNKAKEIGKSLAQFKRNYSRHPQVEKIENNFSALRKSWKKSKKQIEIVQKNLVEFQQVRFFESGSKKPDKIAYHTHFAQNEARYIYYDLQVKNLKWKKRKNNVEIDAEYYGPDGKLLEIVTSKQSIEKDLETAAFRDRGGSRKSGKWETGEYKVVFRNNGKKLGEATFQIYDEQNTLVFTSTKFYESNQKGDEKLYARHFSKKTSRYISFELEMKNLLYDIRDQKVDIVARYYRPNGRLMNKVSFSQEISQKKEKVTINNGLGWKNPGNWKQGKYDVKFYVNDKKVGRSNFLVYDDSKTLKLQSIRFFESNANPMAKAQRQYQKIFPRSKSRYIFFEINYKNLLKDIKSHSVKISARYYLPDGSEMGNPEAEYQINEKESIASFCNGWGWTKAGNWVPGKYRVEFFNEGKKFKTMSFSIDDDIRSVEVNKLSFFEGGIEAKPPEQRVYTSVFQKSKTRYIYYELDLKNLFYLQHENPMFLEVKYYGPDGKIIGSPDLKYTIPSTWPSATLWRAWGWEAPGNWKPGEYTVKVFGSGKILAQKTFVVENDTSTITLQSFQFFEGAPGMDFSKRVIQESFDKSKVRYIFFEMKFANKLYNKQINSINYDVKYYYPDGTFMGNPALKYQIPMNWPEGMLRNAWGWKEPGNWSLGKYTVIITDKGEELGRGHFTIVNRDNITVDFVGMKFFEAGTSPPDQSSRKFTKVFSQRTSRFIYYQVDVKNKLWRNKDNPIVIIAKYYKPGGEFLGDVKLEYTIPAKWDVANLWHGWGWEEPGNWVRGKYRVELYIKGKKIGQDYFTID